jgi:hypothetical protein
MKKNAAYTAWDVKLSKEKKDAFAEFVCRELENAISQRSVPIDEVRYWWTLYEQGRTRQQNPNAQQDAADLTSYLGTEKVDALRARILRTLMVDPIWTVEGWGQSSKKAPFVEDFHQWAAESEGLQAFLARVIHASLIEPRGVLEVFEDTTERVTRKTINAKVMVTPPDPMNPMAPPTWVMDGETKEPILEKGEDGGYIEVMDEMTPSAETVIDEVSRVRKGPGYRVIGYEDFHILPAHAKEKADIWGYAKRFTRRVDQLEEAVKACVYDKKIFETINKSPEVNSAQSPSGQPVPVVAQEGPTAEKELYELQILHNLDGKGLRWYVCTVHLPSKTLLRLKHDDVNKGRYIVFVPFPRTDRSHEGYSFIGHKLITTVEEHTAWRNMLADHAAKVVNMPMKRLSNALWDPDIQPMGVGAVIDVRDMNEIQPMDVPNLSQPAMDREREIISASERVAGINDVAAGMTPQNQRTLGETNLVAEQSFVRMDEVIKNLLEAMEDLGQIRQAIWERALAETHGMDAPAALFEGLEERGGDPSKSMDKVTPDMLSGTYRFKPRGSTENADISRQRQDYMSFLQALPMLMQVWPAMAQQIGMNVEAAKSALEQALRLFRIPDRQAWLAPPPMPGMPPVMPAPPTDPYTHGAPRPPGMPPQIAALLGGGGPPGPPGIM